MPDRHHHDDHAHHHDCNQTQGRHNHDRHPVVDDHVHAMHDQHDHHHDNHHHHHFSPEDVQGNHRFAVVMVLNLAFVVLEVWYGTRADSLSLLADAGHNFGDVLGLVAAWMAAVLVRRTPTPRFTYGMRGSTILAALANAMLLMVAVGGVGWEAVLRLVAPQPVDGEVTMAVALVGVVVNVSSALLLMRGHTHDLNQKGAFLHMASDAVVSLGVALGGWLVMRTGWLWLDPAISLLVAVLILVGTWGLFRESVQLALQAVPEKIDPMAVRAYLERLTQVATVHDLHVWAMSTTENALTAHLVTPAGHPGDAFLNRVADEMASRFQIQHVTLQIELGDVAETCPLAGHAPV